jgi:hypothetical protein
LNTRPSIIREDELLRKPPISLYACNLTSVSFPLGNESNMLRVQEPVIIIGDIHGQFYDMIHMFEKVVDPKGIPA